MVSAAAGAMERDDNRVGRELLTAPSVCRRDCCQDSPALSFLGLLSTSTGRPVLLASARRPRRVLTMQFLPALYYVSLSSAATGWYNGRHRYNLHLSAGDVTSRAHVHRGRNQTHQLSRTSKYAVYHTYKLWKKNFAN